MDSPVVRALAVRSGDARPFERGHHVRAYLTLHPTPPRLGSGASTLPSASSGSPRKSGSSVALRTPLRLVAPGARSSQAAPPALAPLALRHQPQPPFVQKLRAPASGIVRRSPRSVAFFFSRFLIVPIGPGVRRTMPPAPARSDAAGARIGRPCPVIGVARSRCRHPAP